MNVTIYLKCSIGRGPRRGQSIAKRQIACTVAMGDIAIFMTVQNAINRSRICFIFKKKIAQSRHKPGNSAAQPETFRLARPI